VVDAATGSNPSPLELAVRLVRDGGTIVVQNAYQPCVLPTPLRDVFRRSIRLIGSFSYCRRGQDDFAEALTFLQQHSVRHTTSSPVAGHLPIWAKQSSSASTFGSQVPLSQRRESRWSFIAHCGRPVAQPSNPVTIRTIRRSGMFSARGGT